MTTAKQLNWIVTAGPTCEDIDPVRFISNRSSGRMGYAIAREAVALGGKVSLVSGPVAIAAPEGCDTTHVRTTREMYDAVLSIYDDADIVVMTAAVADFRPKRTSTIKIKKSDAGLSIDLEPTEDILAELGRRKSHQLLVGFALESPDGDASPDGPAISDTMRQYAAGKLTGKNLDLVVVNGPAAIGAERSTVSVLSGNRTWRDLGYAKKDEHARTITALAAESAAANS